MCIFQGEKKQFCNGLHYCRCSQNGKSQKHFVICIFNCQQYIWTWLYNVHLELKITFLLPHLSVVQLNLLHDGYMRTEKHIFCCRCAWSWTPTHKEHAHHNTSRPLRLPHPTYVILLCIYLELTLLSVSTAWNSVVSQIKRPPSWDWKTMYPHEIKRPPLSLDTEPAFLWFLLIND